MLEVVLNAATASRRDKGVASRGDHRAWTHNKATYVVETDNAKHARGIVVLEGRERWVAPDAWHAIRSKRS